MCLYMSFHGDLRFIGMLKDHMCSIVDCWGFGSQNCAYKGLLWPTCVTGVVRQ